MVLLTDTYGKMGFGGGSTPTGTKEITDTSLTNVADYANAQVVDANLVAGNIKKDVTVLGITGTHEGGVTPTGTKTITDTSLTDVTEYANAQVVDSDLVAGNIKKDVNILGVTGTFEGGGGGMQYATGSFTPTSLITSGQYDIVDISDIGFTPKVFVFRKQDNPTVGIRFGGFIITDRVKPYLRLLMSYSSISRVVQGNSAEQDNLTVSSYPGVDGTKIAINCSSSNAMDAAEYTWYAYA